MFPQIKTSLAGDVFVQLTWDENDITGSFLLNDLLLLNIKTSLAGDVFRRKLVFGRIGPQIW